MKREILYRIWNFAKRVELKEMGGVLCKKGGEVSVLSLAIWPAVGERESEWG